MGYRNGQPQNAKYYLGRERIKIGMQIFRRYIKISTLLRTLLFGVNFKKVSDFVVLRTKAKFVLHIHSNRLLRRGRDNYHGYVMD